MEKFSLLPYNMCEVLSTEIRTQSQQMREFNGTRLDEPDDVIGVDVVLANPGS